jgi:hypothetical protein
MYRHGGHPALYLGMAVGAQQRALLRLGTKGVQRHPIPVGADVEPLLKRIEMMKGRRAGTYLPIQYDTVDGCLPKRLPILSTLSP